MSRSWGKYVEENIQKRGHSLYAILEIPKALRPKFGRARFVQSLGTDSIKTAKVLARKIVADWKLEIAAAKGEPDNAALYRAALAKAKGKGDLELKQVMDAIELEHSNIAHGAAVAFYPGQPVDPAYVQGAEEEAHAKAEDFAARATGKRVKLSDHIEAWSTAAVKAKDYTARTADLGKSVVRGFCGKKELSEFTRQKLQAYINNLVNNDRSASTIKKYLAYLSNFWKYLQRMDVAPYEAKPFDGLQRPKKKNGNGKKRENFPKADIPKLFKASEGRQLHSLIKLAAYTGCRIEELCSLKIANVHDKAAIPYLHIEDGKSENATRDVPIHAAILPLVRILKHASAKAGDEYLLAGLPADKYGDRSETLGREFSALKTELGYDDRYTFHSIRHTFVTELDEAEVSETTRKFIVGHAADKSAVKGYLHPRSLEKKAEAIAKIAY